MFAMDYDCAKVVLAPLTISSLTISVGTQNYNAIHECSNGDEIGSTGPGQCWQIKKWRTEDIVRYDLSPITLE